MRWRRLKKFWSRYFTPRCFGTGGNLSSFDCGLCAKNKKCINVHYGVYCTRDARTGRTMPEVVTFFRWSKPGEYYPDGRMNGDSMCRICANVPKFGSNPKHCSGCLDKGIHTKYKEFVPKYRKLE